MGTVASVHVHDDVDPVIAHLAVDDVLVELERLDAMFSTFRPDSAISRINRGALHPLDAPAEVVDVLDAVTWLEHASGGTFRAHPPEHPDMIDPAGFVKGWAAERASRRLSEAGLEHWYVAVGGDLQAHGRPRSAPYWRIAIADPSQPGEVAGALRIAAGAVATSGLAERGAHLWHGGTGRRLHPEGADHAGLAERGDEDDPIVSMTVIGPHLAWVDAFATVAFVMGRAGLDWVSGFADHQAVAVTAAGELLATSGVSLSGP
jgi:thiamine biosynthesis lipoprotein